MDEDEVLLSTKLKIKYNNELKTLDDVVGCKDKYNDLFVSLFNEFEKEETTEKIILLKFTDPNDEDNFEVILQTSEQNEKNLFSEENEIEENGEKILFLYFEVYFENKIQLKVFYFAENNKNNITEKTEIEKFSKALSTDLCNYVYCHDPECKLEDSELMIEKDDNQFIVVITTGRYVKHVIQKLKSNLDTILIYTSSDLVSSMTKEYMTNDNKQVKFVSDKLHKLLQKYYFIPMIED